MSNYEYNTRSELQDAFTEQIAPYVVKQYGTQDQIALDTAFNDWTDSLCKDGAISDELYETTCPPDYDDSELLAIANAALRL